MSGPLESMKGSNMAVDLAVEARERGIKYFLISYVDLFGTLRAKLAPASAIGDMARDGAGFAGFASWLDMTPADPDVLAIPDPASLIQLVAGTNQFSGSVPAMEGCSALKTLELPKNRLTGQIPDFSDSPLLRNIYLRNNLVTLVPLSVSLVLFFPSLPLLLPPPTTRKQQYKSQYKLNGKPSQCNPFDLVCIPHQQYGYCGQ